jgi:hypothetical protein
MRKPVVAKPRTAATFFSLSRKLPKLKLPRSAAAAVPDRPRPNVGRPGRTTTATQPSIPVQPPPSSVPPVIAAAASTDASTGAPTLPSGDAACARCSHGEADHPVRYVCDKYPHPDPLQICGCESPHLEEVCSLCGHKARWHKPRHRCRTEGCHCWAFEQT